MSIDFLWELEREVDNGREYYACPGPGRNRWIIAETADELRKTAQRTAAQRKMPTQLVRLIPTREAVAGDLFLVPVKVGDAGPRGEPTIEWSVVETKEASEMMRDLRHGPAPYFAMTIEETFEPEEPGDPAGGS